MAILHRRHRSLTCRIFRFPAWTFCKHSGARSKILLLPNRTRHFGPSWARHLSSSPQSYHLARWKGFESRYTSLCWHSFPYAGTPKSPRPPELEDISTQRMKLLSEITNDGKENYHRSSREEIDRSSLGGIRYIILLNKYMNEMAEEFRRIASDT